MCQGIAKCNMSNKINSVIMKNENYQFEDFDEMFESECESMEGSLEEDFWDNGLSDL